MRPQFCAGILLATTIATAQISVPALVTDRSGKSVHGLQKSDFDVRCPKAASFDSLEEIPPLRFNGFAEPVPLFILFDEVSVARKTQTDLSRVLLRYLRKASDEHLAVTLLANAPNGVRVIHDMSTDPKIFAAAMDRLMPQSGQPSMGQLPVSQSDEFLKAVVEETAALNELTRPVAPLVNENMETHYSRQFEGLRTVGTMLQRSPKRKLLVWISGSFPVYVEDGDLTYKFRGPMRPGSSWFNSRGSQRIGTLNSHYQAAIDALNAARISVYPMGVMPDEDSLDGLAELAKRTGGARLVLSGALYNDALEEALQNFASTVADVGRNFDSYYVFTFRIQPGGRRTWIDSSLKLRNSDAKIVAASGFFSNHE